MHDTHHLMTALRHALSAYPDVPANIKKPISDALILSRIQAGPLHVEAVASFLAAKYEKGPVGSAVQSPALWLEYNDWLTENHPWLPPPAEGGFIKAVIRAGYGMDYIGGGPRFYGLRAKPAPEEVDPFG